VKIFELEIGRTKTHSLENWLWIKSRTCLKSLCVCTFNHYFYILIDIYMVLFLSLFMYVATLTEIFPCFFLSCKANARVKPAKTGHGPHPS